MLPLGLWVGFPVLEQVTLGLNPCLCYTAQVRAVRAGVQGRSAHSGLAAPAGFWAKSVCVMGAVHKRLEWAMCMCWVVCS